MTAKDQHPTPSSAGRQNKLRGRLSTLAGRVSPAWKAAVGRLASSPLANFLLALAERTPLGRRLRSSVLDPERGIVFGSGDMERDWDDRAHRNARYYVAGFDWKSEEEFARSGERDLERIILKGLDLPASTVALEIGCGLGRLLRPLSARVQEVHGVDISAEMVRRAAEELKDCHNVHVHHIDGGLRRFPTDYFSFCYSYTVFQHIPDKAAVLRYIQDVAFVLQQDGLFRFQICRGKPGAPRNRGGGTWLGAVFTEAEIREALSQSGFSLIDMVNEDTPADRSRWDSIVVTCQKPA